MTLPLAMFIPVKLAFASLVRGRRRPGRDASGGIEKRSCHQALIGSKAWPNEPQTRGLLAKNRSWLGHHRQLSFASVRALRRARKPTNVFRVGFEPVIEILVFSLRMS
jgi:hypothetical protein